MFFSNLYCFLALEYWIRRLVSYNFFPYEVYRINNVLMSERMTLSYPIKVFTIKNDTKPLLQTHDNVLKLFYLNN